MKKKLTLWVYSICYDILLGIGTYFKKGNGTFTTLPISGCLLELLEYFYLQFSDNNLYSRYRSS